MGTGNKNRNWNQRRNSGNRKPSTPKRPRLQIRSYSSLRRLQPQQYQRLGLSASFAITKQSTEKMHTTVAAMATPRPPKRRFARRYGRDERLCKCNSGRHLQLCQEEAVNRKNEHHKSSPGHLYHQQQHHQFHTNHSGTRAVEGRQTMGVCRRRAVWAFMTSRKWRQNLSGSCAQEQSQVSQGRNL